MPLFSHARNVTINGGVFIDNQGDPATIRRMKEILEDGERRKVLAWVSPMDVSAKQSDVADVRQPGTGEWLLKCDPFREWEDGTGQALWCSGIPGAGKTVLTSLIVDHLRAFQRREAFGTVGVAWVYYNYKEEITQTPEAIQLSLIRQLAQFSPELYALLESSYREDPNSRPSARQLIPDVHVLMRIFARFFIVIDALDECAEANRDIFLRIMTRLQISGANVLITSRDHVCDSITHSGLVGVQRVDIRGSTNDITKFLNARLIEQRRLAKIIRTDPSLRDEIIKVIVGRCDGMFLMATFHIESLGKHINPGRVRNALKDLPSTFLGIYDEGMHRIESDNDYSEDALRIISFLIHARRPLTLTELQHFLAVTPGDTDFHDEYITDKDILLSICAGLVVMDDKTGIVRLVHYTAQEYFDKIRASKFPAGDLEMGRTCLTYLSFTTFGDYSNLPSWNRRYSLLKYIVHHWHIHILNHQEALRSLLWDFFTNTALLRAYYHFLQKYRSEYFGYRAFHHGHTGLHAAAAAGLALVVSWLIVDADINSKDSTGKTALIHSSRGGYTKIVDFLIAKGADINVGGVDGTALQVASKGGHEVLAKLLLEHGADIDAPTGNPGTPLMMASRGGHAAVVELLLENGADVNVQAGEYGNALIWASGNGHEAIVKLLLENGADTNVNARKYGTALTEASSRGHAMVVKLLLEHGADINTQVGRIGPALTAASRSGNEAMVRLLLEHGADINIQAGSYGTALTAASDGNHLAVVKLLLDNGAEIDSQAGEYGTALTVASRDGHETVVKLLLNNGANINVQAGRYGTALAAASEGGYEAVMKLLLEKGANINAEGGESGTALTVASSRGHEIVVNLLLEHGADINVQAGRYGTALAAASRSGYEAIVKLLLENGADINVKAGRYGTALMTASDGNHTAVVKLLLENGAKMDVQASEYGTVAKA